MERTITEFGNLRVNVPTCNFDEYLDEAYGISYDEYDACYTGSEQHEMLDDYWFGYRRDPMNLICLYLFGTTSYNWDAFLNQEGAE